MIHAFTTLHSRYEHVLVALVPLDSLHRRLVADAAGSGGVQSLLDRPVVKARAKGFGRLQKWSAYVVGLQGGLLSSHLSDLSHNGRSAPSARAVYGFERGGMEAFDLVLFRSHVEMELFKQTFPAHPIDVEGETGR